MIARARPARRAAGSIEPGDVVRCVAPRGRLNGARGEVWSVDGSTVGVVWKWGIGGVSDFYAAVPRKFLKVTKRGGRE